MATQLLGLRSLHFCERSTGPASTWDRRLRTHDSYLVDPASSHMLVSKIKPCMSKYKQLYTVKLQMAHYISYSLFDGAFTTWITVVILELIHA